MIKDQETDSDQFPPFCIVSRRLVPRRCPTEDQLLIYYWYVPIRNYLPEKDFQPVLELYEAVGWTTYTKNPEKLKYALYNSAFVLVFSEGNEVRGLVRCVSDDHTICYIQDILVNPAYQRHGIGHKLLTKVLENYAHVRQVVLMTDYEEGQRNFYESLGFREIKGDLRGFARIQP